MKKIFNWLFNRKNTMSPTQYEEGLIRSLEAILQVNENDEYAYEKAFLSFRNIQHLPVFTYKVPRGSWIFRTRTHDNQNYFSKISEISYPKNEFVKKYARLNRPFQSLFYGSENRPTSYIELAEYWAEGKKMGEVLQVTIGIWEFQRDVNLLVIPKPKKEDRKTDAEKIYGEMFDDFLIKGGLTEFGKINSRIIFEYMSKEMGKPAKKDIKTYIITSSFANIMLHNTNVDGILYPSVPFGGNGYNIGLRRDLVDNGIIKLIEVVRDTFAVGATPEGKHHFLNNNTQSTKNIDLSRDLITW